MECRDCLWCNVTKSEGKAVTDGKQNTMHECRVGEGDASSPGGRLKWPLVWADDWCGMFMLRAAHEPQTLTAEDIEAAIESLDTRKPGYALKLAAQLVLDRTEPPDVPALCTRCNVNQLEFDADDFCGWCQEEINAEQGS